MKKDTKIYAVIDTNVIVSALISKHPGTVPLTVLANVFSGDITPVFNDEIIEEYQGSTLPGEISFESTRYRYSVIGHY